MSDQSIEEKRILIVEDDPLLLNILAERFKKENYIVKTLENGVHAVDVVKAFLPNVLLLDLVLPEVDGFTIIKELKKDNATKAVPIVVLSNLAQPTEIDSARKLGAEKFFIKANTKIDEIFDYIRSR
ncbi:MAG: response regulator [Candidatus Magasanikbacteria bacterium]|nr:response regulator [Candidatus Magasanikbacteria bacterium]